MRDAAGELFLHICNPQASVDWVTKLNQFQQGSNEVSGL
jgi:hypothetical protein